MIVVTGYLTINPAKRAEAETAIKTLVPLTEAEEGCVQYRYAADLLDPDRIKKSLAGKEGIEVRSATRAFDECSSSVVSDSPSTSCIA